MQNPGSTASFKPEEAYAAAAARFFEMMKSFGMSGAMTDWTSLAAPLASQFERWLQMSQAASPWARDAAAGGSGGLGLGFPGTASFGPLPIGPAAVPGAHMPRSFELLGRLAQLQGELAKHWSQIAATAAQRFIGKLGSTPTVPTTPQQALQLYELWVNCAEEAYAATVHREDFGRLQSELANATAALLAEQRQQAEALVRAFGLPTREEVDKLYAQLKELGRQFAEIYLPRDATRRVEPEPEARGRGAPPQPRAQAGADRTGAGGASARRRAKAPSSPRTRASATKRRGATAAKSRRGAARRKRPRGPRR